MKLSQICIRRPVFATVLSLIIVLLGVVSFTRLSVREYPKIDEPVVTVDTRYRGASAEIIESQVTKPLEDSIAGIEGIEVLTSISRSEQSQISVRFKLTRDPDSAAADVRDRVSRVRQRLPADIDEPVIAKVEADANPIIWLAFTSDRHHSLEITDYANRIVKPRLQTLTGVADVRVNGERRYAMRIYLDRDRMAALRLTPQDVEDAIRRQNVEIPAGRIESQQREFNVVAETDLTTAEQFGNVIVRNINGANVRLRDIAEVKIAPQNERSLVRFNGRSAVSLGMVRQATANPLDLAQAVKTELPRIAAELPPGMQVAIANDQTVFIEAAIFNVYKTIAEAVLLVGVVVFFFLRSWRATLIPLIAIPVSLIGAFALMYAFGFSINTLTLLALVLAIGLVVDDAIVVLENIFRHIEDGTPPLQAAFKGMQEISFAVVVMTLTLVAVFVPLAFQTGRTGRLFVEFALALAGAVVVSGFVALTLSPMMCSKLLRAQDGHGGQHGWWYHRIETILERLTHYYGRALGFTLRHRWLGIVVVVLMAATTWLYLATLKRELAPVEDRATLLVQYRAPEGASLEFTSRYGQRIEGIAKDVPEIDRVFVVSGNPTVTQGISFLRLEPWAERERSVREIVRDVAPKVAQIPGVNAFTIIPPSLGQRFRERPVNFILVSSASYPEIQRMVDAMLVDIRKNPGLQAVDTDLQLNRPELKVSVDRDKAADAGVQVEAVGRTLETMLGGRQVTRFKKDGEQYDVIVQVGAQERATPEDIASIFVRGRLDQMIPLSSLVSIDESVAPRELNHFAQRRAVSITANLAPDYTLGEALAFMQQVANKHITPGTTTDLDGQSREFRDSSSSLALTFVLALAFIYLVMAAQFESFRDPFIIMLTVPLGMVGALGALDVLSRIADVFPSFSAGSLNVYSQIGLITLVGLITKNGILIVEFANQLQEQGKHLMSAIHESAMLRLRPILMTTLATVFGALPLAFSSGAGAESRQQIGWVIVGGMTFGTVLTLFVIPAIYTYMARQRNTQDAPSTPPTDTANA